MFLQNTKNALWCDTIKDADGCQLVSKDDIDDIDDDAYNAHTKHNYTGRVKKCPEIKSLLCPDCQESLLGEGPKQAGEVGKTVDSSRICESIAILTVGEINFVYDPVLKNSCTSLLNSCVNLKWSMCLASSITTKRLPVTWSLRNSP